MNYYTLFNLPKNASKQQIKNAYKKLVKQYHPDLYRGDKAFAEQKMKEINEAYAILSNPEKKSEYDESLKPPEYSNSVSFTSTASTTTNPSPNPNSENRVRKFITEKLAKLDKKHQLQIFILFLIIILALFLINLIQVQHYLTNQNQSSTNQSTVFNTTNSIYDFPESNTSPTDENFKTLDDLFNEMLAPYFNKSFYENYVF